MDVSSASEMRASGSRPRAGSKPVAPRIAAGSAPRAAAAWTIIAPIIADISTWAIPWSLSKTPPARKHIIDERTPLIRDPMAG